jgi:hypothetical protein
VHQKIHPEAELIRKTVILRQLDLPPSVAMTKRALLRWVALSLGLISPGESRSTMLAVLDGLFYFQFKEKRAVSVLELKEFLRQHHGIETSEKLVRYHLSKLSSLELIRKKKNLYSFNAAPHAERDDVGAAIEYWIGEHTTRIVKEIANTTRLLTEKY